MGFLPARNQFDSQTSGSSPSGASVLEGPPPHMAPRPAGADTNAIMGRDPSAGADGSGGGNGPLAMSPKARIIAAVAMLMQATNIIEATLPGALTPQFMMEVDNARVQLPMAVDSMAQQSSPLGLLSAIGSALAPGMGMPGAGGGMPSLGGGQPAAGGGNPSSGGMPTLPQLPQSAGVPSRQPMPPQ